MPRGDWGPVLTLIGIAAALALVVGWANFTEYQSHHVEERERAAQHDTSYRRQGQADCVPIPGSERLTCAFAIIEPGEHDPYAEYDLRAQQEMAEWALVMAALSAVALVVAVVGVVYVAQTLDAARVANEGFADAARRQLRAYVAVDELTVTVRRPQEMIVRFEFTLTLRNCGQTPAKNVHRFMEVWPMGEHAFVVMRDRGNIGRSSDKRSLDMAPGRPFVFEYSMLCRLNEPHSVLSGVEIKGWVEYSDFAGDRWRVPYECKTDWLRLDVEGFQPELGPLLQYEEERA